MRPPCGPLAFQQNTTWWTIGDACLFIFMRAIGSRGSTQGVGEGNGRPYGRRGLFYFLDSLSWRRRGWCGPLVASSISMQYHVRNRGWRFCYWCSICLAVCQKRARLRGNGDIYLENSVERRPNGGGPMANWYRLNERSNRNFLVSSPPPQKKNLVDTNFGHTFSRKV